MAMIVALLLGMGALPWPSAEAGHPRGYLVFSDTLPVGPDLDATFHAVVPEGVEVLSATIDLWGRVGTLPVAAGTDTAGEHTHILATTGGHAHTTSEDDGHNHTIATSEAHSHMVQTDETTISLNNARMSVALPAHTHTPSGSMVIGYDFAAETSLEHNHTALDHGHSASIALSGLHQHTSDTLTDHAHDLTVEGEHSHASSTLGDHSHKLSPDVAADPAGSVPTGVRVTLVSASASTELGGTFGGAAPGWHASADLTGLLDGGVTRMVLASDTTGAIEYLLVIGVDTPCSAIAGHGVVGPLAPLEVPVYSPDVPSGATAHLFGASLPTIVPSLDLAEGHEHAVVEDGTHAHTMDGAGSHTHDTQGGDHTHDATVGVGSVTVADTTPDWSLLQHSHTLTWAGNQITSVGDWGYGTGDSVPHTHIVLGHGHSVTMTNSGAHEHSLSDVAGHIHTMTQEGAHVHDVQAAGAHDHLPMYSPTATTGPGPTGVRAALDGSDITDANGGPWGLVEAPVDVELPAAALVGPHVLRLTASTEGAVEWVFILMHAQTRLVVSLRSVGDMKAHVPNPDGALSAEARVFASPYVMTVQPTSSTDAGHSHTTSSGGGHAHVVTAAGGHVHQLDPMQHDHGLSLANTSVTVVNSTGTVDLPSHTHTVTLGSQSTGLNRVTGTTGMHTHTIEEHVHDIEWSTSGTHDHPVDSAADHVHALNMADGHAHSMSGGAHEHTLSPGAVGNAAYPSPSDVSLLMGAATTTGLHPVQEATWWDYTDLSAGLAEGAPVLTLDASSATLGTLNVIVVFTLDSVPPLLSLASAPQWVRPGQAFQVSVAASVDIVVATVELEVAGIAVSAPVLNATASVIEFACTCSLAAPDGVHPMLARGADLAGNPFEGVIGSITVDGTAPTITVRTGERSLGAGSYTWVSPATDVIVELSDGGSGPGAVRYGPEPGRLDSLFDPSDPFLFKGFAEGMHDLHFGGADLAGNPVDAPILLHVRLDATPPDLRRILAPSATLADPPATVVGPNTVLTVLADDGLGGSGVVEVQYAVDDGANPVEWRGFSYPRTLMDDLSSRPLTATLMLRAYDAVGNMAGHDENLTVDRDVPSVNVSAFLPDQLTNRSALAIHSTVGGDVAIVHLQSSTMHSNYPQDMTLTVDEAGAVDFELVLSPGPNYVRVAFEDRAGNTSPWAWRVITLDTDAPSVVSTVPTPGSRDLDEGTVRIDIVFSEVIDRMTLVPRILVDGGKASPLELQWDIDWGNRLSLIYDGAIAPGSKVDVSLLFKDPAGNAGTYEFTIWTAGGSELEVNAGDFLWGLFIGLVLGIVVAYLVVLRLRRGSAPRRTPGPRPLLDMGLRPAPSILAPEEDRLDGLEGEMLGAERPTGTTTSPSEEGKERSNDAGGGPGGGKDGADGSAKDVEEKDDRSAGTDGGRDEGEGDHHHADDDGVDDELSADLDRLIEQARGTSDPEATGGSPENGGIDDEQLPDPDQETVDPGTR